MLQDKFQLHHSHSHANPERKEGSDPSGQQGHHPGRQPSQVADKSQGCKTGDDSVKTNTWDYAFWVQHLNLDIV